MKTPFLNKVNYLGFTFILLIFFISINKASGQVKVWEDELVVPTYKNTPPNKMPRYYEGKGHQGVQRRMYPYPMDDNLRTEKVDETYHIVYLENDYIKLGIMPALGGRIFEGIDKTNGYNFFYRNHVIKPSLIGMVGTWISGSNAWGFPHHHGPNTVKSLDYFIEEHEDKSVTVWSANIDKRHRMRILIGYTIYPNSSIVEMTIRPDNRSPIVNSMLFWSNPSVHVDENYQVIFPPSVEYVTQHSKREMTSWPIANKRYNSYNYDGVDISWWKNIGVPSSFFSWNPQEDFFGGYDHGKNAGTLWVGNHHVMPGMKFWAWGNNAAGDKANSALTDEDGHYIELMAGAFTDNQPDYSWLQPYENKDVKMTWYPIRLLGGIKDANEHGALNLEISKNVALLRLNSTSPRNGVSVILADNGKKIFEEKINIDPARPYSKEVKLPKGSIKEDIQLSLLSAEGETLLAYQPKKKANNPEPAPLEAPLAPEEIKTNEELYLTGLRLNQFYNANIDPLPYYEEALRRDPGDYRVNTQMGILYLKGKNWEEAEKHLQTAVERITSNYTRPKDSEAQYYLALAQRELGKVQEAYDNLYGATWNAAWHSPAFYQLSEIDSKRGDYKKALDHLNRSLNTNGNNLKALNLKMAVLRKLGRLGEAESLASKTIEKDLLNYQSRNELALIKAAQGSKAESEAILAELSHIMRDEVQSYMEFATDYANAGFYEEAREVLSRLEEKGNKHPMLHYYLGYYSSKLGQTDKAKTYYAAAGKMPYDYVFPFRAEALDVLNHAIEINAEDAMAWYYMGNILYEEQPENAILAWENSIEIDSTFYIPHRNLGLAYREVENDIEKSLRSYQKAFASNKEDPRLIYELDDVAEAAKVSPKERYETIFANNHKASERRSETLLREVQVLIAIGKYDEAINFLTNNSFPQFEGGGSYRDAYQNAFVLRGKAAKDRKDYDHALEDFRAALDFPVGRWGWARRAQFHYLIGEVYEVQGKKTEAKKQFELASQQVVEDTEYVLYKGLAYQKLDKTEEAQKQFDALLAMSENTEGTDFFRQFEGGKTGDALKADIHYLKALAFMSVNQNEKALQEFRMSTRLNPSHLWAQVHSEELNSEKVH